MEGILGRKLGMTQIFNQLGDRVPVTVIQAGPCRVVRKRKVRGDGHTNVQVAFEECKEKALNRPLVGELEKRGLGPHRFLRELHVADGVAEGYEDGSELRVEAMFRPGDMVDISGTTKGHGFTGVMKRHGFAGAKATHGTHEYFRHGGSIGASADPARVFKGTRMPGQHGNTRVTIQNLEVVQIFPEKNLLLVKGAVPGPNKGVVEVCRAIKKNARPSE